jgi:hypothetical protein
LQLELRCVYINDLMPRITPLKETIRDLVCDLAPFDHLEKTHLDFVLQSIDWFNLNEIPYDRTDPHIGRFIKKFSQYLLTWSIT